MMLIEAQVLKRLQAYQSDAPGPETFRSSRAITKADARPEFLIRWQ